MIVFLLLLLSGATAIPPPIVTPVSGYKPLRVHFSMGFTPNSSHTPVDIRYTVDANIPYVACVGPREKSIGSGDGYRIFTTSGVLHVKTCFDINTESDVVRVVLTVSPWIGANPLVIVYGVVVGVLFGLSSFTTKVKLRGAYSTWFTTVTLLPLLAFPVYTIVALDCISTGQTENIIVGVVLIVLMLGAGAANYWYLGRLLESFVDTDRKMDWWCTTNLKQLKYIKMACTTGLGVFSIVFTRWLDKGWTNAQFNTTNRTFDRMRMFDRLTGLGVLVTDLPATIIFLLVVSRNSQSVILPTSTIIGLVVAVIVAGASATRTLFGLMNMQKTEVQVVSVRKRDIQLELAIRAQEAAAEAKADLEAGGAGSGLPTGKNPYQKKKRRKPKKTVVLPHFDPMRYTRKLKYTNRNLPDFEDMT